MPGQRSTIGLAPLLEDESPLRGSLPKASQSNNPYVEHRPQATIEELKEASARIQKFIEKSRAIESNGEVSTKVSLGERIELIQEYTSAVHGFIEVVNALPDPSPGRDRAVGEALVPFAVLAANSGIPAGPQGDFIRLYHKTHQRGGKPSVHVPDWLKPSALYLVPHSAGQDFPDKRTYLRQSPSQQNMLTAIEAEEKEMQRKISDLEEKNNKAKTNSGKPTGPFDDVIPGLRTQLEAIQSRIPPLFENLHDVNPEEIPEALNAIGVKAGLSPRIIQSLRYAETGLHEFLIATSLSKYREFPNSMRLRVPLLKGRGEATMCEQVIDAESFAGDAISEEVVAQVFDTLMGVRATLAKLLPTLELSGVTGENAEKVKRSLKEPFSILAGHGESALAGFLEKSPALLQEKCAKLFAQPILTESGTWEYPLDKSSSTRLLDWAVAGFIRSKGSNSFRELLQSSGATSGTVLSMLEPVQEYLHANNYQKLIIHLNEQFQLISESTDPHLHIAFISMMAYLTEDEEAGSRLRHQLPETEMLKQCSRHFEKTAPDIAAFVSARAHKIVRALSSSLDDFLNLEGGEELVELIETYRFLIQHPDSLTGLKGNEAFRSGVLLEGEPGVGKTYLVDCLANELGIQKLKISPEEIEGDKSDMLTVAKRICKEAKEKAAKGEFCILFIDEAEALLAERSNPNIPPEKERMCDYLLQELNDIRQKHPSILIVVATNFIHRIDEAVLRDGRLDYHVRMDPPNPTARQNLIETTLAKRKVQIDLSDDQMKQLVTLSDGFMPLTITRAITEETGLRHKIRLAVAHEKGSEVPDISFDHILSRFKSEKERHDRRVKRKEEKARQFGTTSHLGSTPTPSHQSE